MIYASEAPIEQRERDKKRLGFGLIVAAGATALALANADTEIFRVGFSLVGGTAASLAAISAERLIFNGYTEPITTHPDFPDK